MTPTLFDPHTRSGDPITSHIAAARVKPGRAELVNAIRYVVGGRGRQRRGGTVEPMDAFTIAREVEVDWPGRWSQPTILTAISRAGLLCADIDGVSPRGIRCSRYVIGRGL